MFRSLKICGLLLLAGQARAALAVEPTIYRVGVAKIDITPDYPIRLNGFGFRRDESEGVSQRIHARALAISRADEPPLVLLAIDSLGVRMPFVDQVAQRLQQAHGIPREHVALTFTHSHCTPKVNGASDNIFSQPIPPSHQEHIDRYTGELAVKIEQAAREAITGRQPAFLEWGVGSVGFAVNRRTKNGPVDHDLPVLVVRDPDNHELRAVYVSYACHCVTLSFNQISGDWAGYAAELLEKSIPGATALVSIGCGSDANPSTGVTGDKTALAELQGAEIATEVQRLLAAGLAPVSGAVAASLQTIDLPLHDPPAKEQLEALAAQGGPAGYNATTQLARLARGETLLTKIEYPVQVWSWGESLSIVFLAGEVCADYSLRLKTELDRQRLWINAYSNDFCAYIPSERLVREGGYGGGAEIPYFALPNTLRPGLEQLIVDQVHRQVPATLRRAERTQGVPPKSPDESLRCLRTHDELRVELAASEPLVTDPVAIDFGPDGRLWVAEMNDYGHGVYEKFAPTGRVRWLRDRDQDGRFDETRVFVERLRFPTDVKLWRDGVLICDAPDILLARDADGDGRADLTTKLFTGFEIRNAQARVNSLRLGLDNWLHGAGGLFGGKIKSAITGQTTDISGQDFRLNPDTGEIQAVSGRTQQGRDRNDWGDWFGCTNGNLLLHFPIEDRYHLRNPRVAPPPTSLDVVDADAGRLIPPGELVTFELSGAPGRATAACGLGVYRDDWLGEQYRGNAFTCEPVHQLVHRLVLEPRGVTFAARRADNEAEGEFLSSTDRWFRPVQARSGPDGALWIVDMYRYVIEHPRWIPQDTLQQVDVFAGRGLGRIYRVLPRHGETSTPPTSGSLWPRLDPMSDDQLVQQLDQPNGELRDLAQQLLVWRRATRVQPQLQKLVQEAKLPLGQIHALSTLSGLGVLSTADLRVALRSRHPQVIRFAIRLAEQHLDEDHSLLSEVLTHGTSTEPQVRLQVAYSLGESRDARAAQMLVQMAHAAGGDAYLSAAVLSSLSSQNAAAMLTALLELPADEQRAATMQELLPHVVAAGEPSLVLAGLQAVLQYSEKVTPDQLRLLARLLSAADRQPPLPDARLDQALTIPLQALFSEAAASVSRADTTDQLRQAAVDLLARPAGPFTSAVLGPLVGERSQWLRQIAELLSAKRSVQLQLEAVAALSRSGDESVPELLLKAWDVVGPGTRTEMIDVLLTRPAWTMALLQAVEAGPLKPTHFDATRRQRLLAHSQTEIRALAEHLLQSGPATTRAVILESYLPALAQAGDVAEGRIVFRKHCASCHRLEDQGFSIGPDLLALTSRSKDWLLTAILDPNRDVDARYIGWTAILADGRAVTGLIGEETSASIRLVEGNGKEHVLLRAELDELRSSEKSIMPEGIERDVSPAAAADLIAYILSFESPPKIFAGNQPAMVAVNEQGEYRLTAACAELRGGAVVFEQLFGNVGYWHGEQDHATWRVEVPTGGQFDLYLDWSCADESAGNRYRIDVDAASLAGRAAATGGWDRYRQAKIGSISLAAGRHAVTMRPDGPLVKPALLDLRELRLVPAGAKTIFANVAVAEAPLPLYPPQIAPFLLDESNSEERRKALIDLRPGMGAGIIAEMTADLQPGSEEEYRRIPWIWRVAIAVGKRNDGGELRDLLDVSLPKGEQPLHDWQAVVIGGGVINGISQLGLWPRERLAEVLADVPEAPQRWPRALQLASVMADNEKVRTGTRYDALRMIALDGWENRGDQLVRYLADGVDDELHMGAVSGLSDVPSEQVAGVLIGRLANLSANNRKLALEALQRTEQRGVALLESVQAGHVARDLLDRDTWLKHPSPRVKELAERVWSN